MLSVPCAAAIPLAGELAALVVADDVTGVVQVAVDIHIGAAQRVVAVVACFQQTGVAHQRVQHAEQLVAAERGKGGRCTGAYIVVGLLIQIIVVSTQAFGRPYMCLHIYLLRPYRRYEQKTRKD